MNDAKNLQSGRSHAMLALGQLIDVLLREDGGQDLIEYALVFSFVALGVIASMKSVTAGVVAVFTAVGTTLTNAT